MRLMLIAMPRAVMPRVAASTCGSIALAYSAVHDPAALSSTQSPRVWPLSKIPAVTAPFLRARRSTTPACRYANGRQDRTGGVAAGPRGYITGRSAGNFPHLLGRIERDLAPPSYCQKLTN